MIEEQLKKKIKDIVRKYHKSSDKNNHFKALSEIAKLRGGKIKVGEVYIKNSIKMTFIDKLGNEFQMIPSAVKSGSWSPYESGTVRNDNSYHMKKLEEIAKSKGGGIKEGEIYINNRTKMTFIDKLGNEFKMDANHIKSGRWSPYESDRVCNDSEYHMKKLQKIAISKGGQIKNGELYVNNSTKMIFVDRLGNEFKMTPNAVKNGQWSPYESGNVTNPEYHIKKLQKIAAAKGGKIKNGELYVNNSTKMIFIDRGGNEFEMTPSSVKSGNWSPYEKNLSEHICRQVIEQLYDNKFESCWKTIKRIGKKNLQLDGYCPQLKIAFEYQGIQHTNGWANNKKSLISIKKRDEEKKQICKNMGILLLEINYYKKINNISDIIQQTIRDVKKSYKNNGLSIPEHIYNFNIEKINIDFSKINNSVLMYEKLNEIAKSKGGKIKEGEIYISNSIKMTFIDKLGNEFQALPANVKNGHWSPYEAKCVRNDYEYHMKKLKRIVNLKGGKIKDGEIYINNSTKITFVDKLGNEFKSTPNSIKNGHWSPYESGNVRDSKYHIEQLKKIAKSKGGKIKEGEIYINNSTKMIFVDKLGNEFEITPSAVKRGNWSPYESGNVTDPEYHMKILKEIAQLKGGKIKEGEKYINNRKKMTFVDKLGNEFEITPGSIKRGNWSPYESGKVRNNPEYHMKQLEEIAKSKCGKIKEGEIYINCSTKMTFVDKLGNEFQMRPDSVKSGSWSPFESGNVYNNPEYHMKELQKIVISKEGRIKEGEIYINNSTKMAFVDKLGNEFKMTPSSVKRGYWSPYESGNVRETKYHIKKLEEIVKLKGGKIKEGESYINSKTKMIFVDKQGNEFEKTPSDIKSGKWSPYELKNR